MEQLFTPNGRLGRLAYLAHYLLASIAALIAMGVVFLLANITSFLMLLIIPVYIAALVYFFIISIRRLHDMNASGWWSILLIIPLVSLFFIIAICCIKGTQAENAYGAVPVTQTWERNLGWVGAILFPMCIASIFLFAVPAYQDYIKKAQEAQSRLQQPAQIEMPTMVEGESADAPTDTATTNTP